MKPSERLLSSVLLAAALAPIASCGAVAEVGAPAPTQQARGAAPMQQAMHAMEASAAAPAAPAAANNVRIHDFAFNPATITVAAGTTVTWINDDDEPHTVSAPDRSYRSTPMDTGGHFAHSYGAPGEYHYFCTLHPNMTGVVIVRARGNS